MDVPKIDIKKVLYTTDLSDSGRPAFAYAASLAKQYGADLTAMHVIRADPELNKSLVGYIPVELWDEIKKQSLEEARETLLERKGDDAFIRKCVDEFCDNILATGPKEAYISYDIVLKMGHPVERIIEITDTEKYDVIVMASHGHSTLKDAMLGNTVRRVLRRARIPVLVVRTP